MDAPQQYKQPSRKGKKAWRKHVDVTDIQEGLRLVREEEIRGGVISEKPSEELFTIDTTGSEEIAKSQKHKKPLKADEIIAQRSAIPSVDSRKRPNSKVTDGVIEPKAKRPKGSDWVSTKEWERLKKVAQENNPAIRPEDEATYDPWADAPDSSAEKKDSQLDFVEKPKPITPPPTLKQPPISLAANGKPVPSVKKPDGSVSYNPVFEEWDRALTREGEKEVEAEKKRIAEAEKQAERQRLAEEAKNDDGEVKSDDESAWEGFESEYENPEFLKKKQPRRKTKAERNRIKRRKEAEQKAKWEAEMKKRHQQAEQAKKIAREIAEREEARKQLQKQDDSSEEGDDTVLRRRPLGKELPPEKPLELVLPDELKDSLRLLKPEGNLLDDRYRNLVVNGKIEYRKPVTRKKPKTKATEKWAYKDFKVPGL
ncbi:hypothetical protein VTN49DRAFT_5701 [Thermomyces lanuginosus]|uniref:uncharacterized protein n=1 Tax=Thermomyces lanuginosus TaxID=5541 RepID=UPI003742421C